MPKKAHEALEREARKKGLTGDRKDRYVYGTLQRLQKGKSQKRSKPKQSKR